MPTPSTEGHQGGRRQTGPAPRRALAVALHVADGEPDGRGADRGVGRPSRGSVARLKASGRPRDVHAVLRGPSKEDAMEPLTHLTERVENRTLTVCRAECTGTDRVSPHVRLVNCPDCLDREDDRVPPLPDPVSVLVPAADVPEPKPVVKLVGQDGNAFMILGLCQRAARKAGWSAERWTAVRDEMTAGDYNGLLATAMRYFEVE